MRKVLIVDDDKVSRKILANLLADDYEIMEAENGQEAISLMFAESRTLDAVLLDIKMPVMDGLEVLQQRQKNAVLAQIPVLVITESPDEQTRMQAISLGANDFILKPYSPEIIRHCLRNNIEMHEKTSSLALYQFDQLTGIYTCEAFLDVAANLIQGQAPGYYMLACFDIESFKVINDQYGTEIGDEVLKHVAGCIRRCVDALGGISCRVTADDYAVLYPAQYKTSKVLLDCHQETILPPCINQKIRIRIGRYLVDDLTISVNAMYDRAMLAGESIKGRYDIYIAEYSDSMRSRLLSEQQIVNDMDEALKAGQFEPWFQPQYNHATGAMIGAEALVRWKKDGSYISPGAFIPVFERNGFIYEMDQYIWEQVCKHLRRWINEGRSPLPVSVNISRRDLFHQHFIPVLTGIVEKYAIPYALIRLEVTESAFAESSKQIIAKVDHLIQMGFTVEIDDFGSGYSSLNTLKDVPASILKLDMKFFENTENSQRSGNIIESVVRMAKWLDMAVIAEGVEEKSQADYLKSIGCYYIQGYYYAKPMPLEQYEALLDQCQKEPELTGLQTIETLNNNAFWDPKSMETLIFNSYVGGACIFEYHNGKTELLRVNEQYAQALGNFCPIKAPISDQSVEKNLDPENREKLISNIERAIATRQESACELMLTEENGAHREYVRATVRVIATAGDRYLLYGVIVNQTEQREAERKRRDAEKKEMESALRLQVIMENINGGVSALQIDDNGKASFVFNNEKYFELYGYTREQAEAEQLDVMSLIAPEDYEKVMQSVRKLKQDRNPIIIDYRSKRRDGRYVYLRVNSSLMGMEGYGDDVITSVVTDITEQKELADQLQALVDNINGGVTATVIRNGHPEFILVNDRFFEILGYTRAQYEAECHDKFQQIHPDDRERIQKQFEKAAETKKRYTMEYRIIRRDGFIRIIQSNISVIRIFGINEPVQLAVANDITELRMAEQKEVEAADKLKTVLNHAGNGITAVALYEGEGNARILFANDKYFEILGYTREAYHQSGIRDASTLVHPADRAAVREQIREADRSGKDATMEYRLQRPDGSVIWVRTIVTITHLVGIDAPVQVAVFSDITAEKAFMEQLQFLNDSAHEILAQTDSDRAIEQTLEKLLGYFSGDRAYVIELDEVHHVSNNTYEICAAGVRSERARLQNIPFAVSAVWFEMLRKNQYVVIRNVQAMEDAQAALRALLLSQNIQSIMIAPLWRDGNLIGFAGIDNPTAALDQLERLMALGDYIAILLTRRDLNRKIQHDAAAMQQLIDDTPGGFCRMAMHPDAGPDIVRVNAGFCQMLGMSEAETMAQSGEKMYACLRQEQAAASAIDAAKDMASGGQFTTRCTLRRQDGEEIRVMVFGRFVRDESGDLYLNAYFTNITEQAKAEEQQKTLLDNLPCGAALYTYDGRDLAVVHINKKYWELVGREPADFTGVSVFGAVHPDDAHVVRQEMEAAIRQKRNVVCDVRIRHGGGAYLPFHIVANILKQPDGSYAFYTAYTPISEQTMSFQKMLPMALSTMMSTSGDLSFVKDRDLHYICCSQSVAQEIGLANPRDIIGKTDYDLFDAKLADGFVADDRRILEQGESIIDKMERIPRGDHSLRLSTTSKYPIVDAFGHVIGIYGISRDVTAQKEKESQLELLTSSIPGGLAAFSLVGEKIQLLYCNEGFYRFSGYTREEYVQMTAAEPLALILEEDRPNIRAILDEAGKAFQPGDSRSCVFRCRTKAGECRWMELKAVLSQLSDQQILNVVQLDITEQKETEANLRLAEEAYRLATKHSGRTICRYNLETRMLTVAADAAEQLDLPEKIPDVPYSRVKLGKISPDTADAYIAFFEGLLHGQKEQSVTFEKLLSIGWRWINAHGTTIFGEDGKPVSAIISYVDVTEQQEMEAVYRKWQQSLEERSPESYTLFRCDLSKGVSFDTSEGTLIGISAAKDTIRDFDDYTAAYANQKVFAEDRAEYLETMKSEKLISDFYHGKRTSTFDYREIVSANSVRWLRRSVDLVERPNAKGLMAYLMFEDIDARKKAELMTLQRSESDPLTGVLNRAAFAARVEAILRESTADEEHVMMMLDVDDFKRINDVLGHKAGDQALIEITKLLRASSRRCDLVGRLGGDEFMLFLTNMPSGHVTAEKAKRICTLATQMINGDVPMSVSIGIAVYPSDGETFETLYRKADRALYHIKESGKDSYAFYQPEYGD